MCACALCTTYKSSYQSQSNAEPRPAFRRCRIIRITHMKTMRTILRKLIGEIQFEDNNKMNVIDIFSD